MRGNNPPSGLGPLLSQVLKGLDLETRVKEESCLLLWDEVVGEKISSAAQPEFIRDGKLFVVTKSPVWANEMTFLKADIISKLNRRAGGKVVKDIILKAGRVSARRATSGTGRSEAPDLEGIHLSETELEMVKAAAGRAGEDASGAMAGFLATALRLEKWKKAEGWTPCKACGALQNTESGICPVCGEQ